MSYEDSFEREAKDERAYVAFERWYIYENLKPETIGKWEWDLMFDRVRSHNSFSEAAADAAAMAREMGLVVTVKELYEGCWKALPVDYYEIPEGSHWITYAVKRDRFVKDLVLVRKYPDIVALAEAMNHPAKHEISRHSYDERQTHERWRKETEGS